jgi:hypothetical protein
MANLEYKVSKLTKLVESSRTRLDSIGLGSNSTGLSSDSIRLGSDSAGCRWLSTLDSIRLDSRGGFLFLSV